MTFKVKDGLIVGNTTFVSGNLDVNANNINVAHSITIGGFSGYVTVNSSFFTGVANAANFLNGKAESALAANSAVFATNAQFAYTANVANFLNGKAESALDANTAQYLNGYNSDYFANATNITTGTLAEPRLPFRMDQDVRTVDSVEFRNLTVTGDVYFSGNTTKIDTNSVATYDSLIYLNNAKSAQITNAYGNGSSVTYVSNNNFSASEAVIITGMNPSSYNLYSANSVTIQAANSTQFTVSKTTTDIFVGGGTAYAKAALNPDVGFVAGLTIDDTYQHVGFFRDATDGIFKAFDGLIAEPDGPFIDMSNARIADIQANTIYADNAVFGNGSISSSLYSGTANNATYAYGKQESQLYVANAVFATTANNALYAYDKQESQLYVANAVFATTANNTLYAYGKEETQLSVDTANNASHAYGKQESQLYVANAVFATTANNSLRLNGKQESQLYVANAVFATTSNTAFYLGGYSQSYFTNASNITTGTLPWDVMPPTTVNTSSAVTVSNTWSFQDMIIYGGIKVANSFGDTNQVLASNGSGGLFWKQDRGAIYSYQSVANSEFGVMRLSDANNVNNDVLLVGNGTAQVSSNSTYVVINTQDQFVGTVTSVDGGSGLLGGPITDSGSLYVGAGDGISVNQDDVAVNAKEGLTANSSGLWVNTAYFSLLSREADANNSLHLQSRTWESPGYIGYTTPNDGRFLNLQANALSVNTQIIVNNYITVGGTIINSTYFAGIANNSIRLNGKLESQLNVATSNTTLYLDGRKWESPFAIGSTFANSGVFTNLVANTGAFNNLTVYGGISANASFGNTGQVLTSNGTAVFWANSYVDFVANAQFATTANNALYAYGKQEYQLSVAFAAFATASNNAYYAYGKQESQLSVADAALAQTAVLANNATYAYGKLEEQLSVANSVNSNNSTYAYGKQESQLSVNSAVFATTANNALYAYNKQESQLSVAEAVNADQATSANNATYAYGKQESQLSVASSLEANNATYAYGKQESQLIVATAVSAETANNSTYAYGKQEGQLYVANAIFATTANNALRLNGKQESQLSVESSVSSTNANNATYAYGKQESQLYVANAVFATTANNALRLNGKQESQLSVESSVSSTNANNATYAYGKQESQLSVASSAVSNNSTYAYGKQEQQLSVANAVFAETANNALQSITANNATYAYGKQESQLNVATAVSAETANNSTYAYGKQESQLSVDQANNSTYAYGKQESQLYVANAVFATTANNALRLNGKQEAQLYVANAVFATTSNNSLYAYGKQESQLYVANAVFATFAGAVAGGVANAVFADTANNALFLNGANSQFYTNATNISTGTLAEARLPFRMNQNVRTTDDVNFANGFFTGSVSVGGDLILTGNLISTNIQSLTVSDPLIKLGNNNVSDVYWGGFAIHYNGSGNTSNHAGLVRNPTNKEFILMATYGDETGILNDTININDSSFSYANLAIRTLRLGNTSSTGYLDANSYSGTANNASYAYGKQESQLNVATAASTSNAETANNATYAYGKQESQLSVANAVFAISSSSSSNSAALQGRTWQSPFGIGTVSANTGAFTTITASGTVIVGSDITLNAGLIANNSIGIYGQVLSSNGSSIYWTNANNISGTVSNANNSNYLNGKQESQLSVANAVFAITANNATYAYGKQESQLSVSAANNSSYLDGRTWATPFAIGATVANTGAFTTLRARPNQTGSTSGLEVSNNSVGIYLVPRAGQGAYNNLTSNSDNLIYFSNNTQNGGNLVIGSWSNRASGYGVKFTGTSFDIAVVSNTLTINANTVFNGNASFNRGISANGSFGANGNVLTSNGTGVYWSSSFVDYVANAGFSTTANNSLYAYGKQESQLSVANAVFATTANNTLRLNGKQESQLSVSAANNSSYLDGRKWESPFAIGSTVANTGAFTTVTVSSGSYGEVVTTQFASVFGTASGPNAFSIMQVRSNDNITGMGMQAYAGLNSKIYSNTGIVFSIGATLRDKDYPTGGVNVMTLLANGNVGIANTTPGQRLQIDGSIGIKNGLVANGSFGANGNVLTSNGTAVFWASSSVDYVANSGFATTANNSLYLEGRKWASPFAIGATVANTGAFTSLTASANVNLDSGALFVDATTNRVGLGTITPNTQFHISSSGGDATVLMIEHTNANRFPSLIFNSFGGSAGDISCIVADTRRTSGDFGSALHGLIYRSGRSSLGNHSFLNSANTVQMVITEGGNVGIGNTTPTAAFEIQRAGVMARFKSGAATDARVEWAYNQTDVGYIGADSTTEFSVVARVGNALKLGSGAIERMRIDAAGNVSIGSTSAPTKLFVNGHMSVANGFGIYANGTLGASGLVLTSNGTSLFWGSTANNANFLQERTWATPFAIGSTVANTGAFTTLTASANVNLDSGTLFVDGPANRVGVGTIIPSSRFQVGAEVIDDNSYVYDGNTAMVVHQQPTSTTVLNDPKETLLLARQGTGGQAFGAAASFDLSRYENNSVNSRTRLDIKLAHASFLVSPTIGMTLLSSGNVGLGGNTTPGQTLQVDGSVGIKNGLVANGVMGASGTVLTSNGSTIYWAPVSGTIENANNSSYLEGRKWASPFAIGSAVANTGAFTTITTSSAGPTGINITTDTSLATHSGRMFWTNNTAGQGVGIYNDTGVMNFSTGGIPGSGSGTTRMTINSSGVIVATTAGGSFRGPIFYDVDNTAYYFDGSTTGTSINVAGNIIAAGDVTVNGGQVYTGTEQARVKFGVWSDNQYGIGFQTGYTYGGIENDYAMTFQMNDLATRGFWWGDTAHSNAQGAMALTTDGKLTVAHSVKIGFGESDTTVPGATYALEVNGAFAATTKSFVINHPTKPDMKLRYGSLEGPENGVYVRGRLKGNTIELPDYWTGLVDEDTITVSLTPIGKHQNLYVESIADNKVVIGNDNLISKKIDCFYVVYGERNDVDKLVVEY